MSTAHVTILGSNSAIPAHGRNPTSQVLELGGETILIDCGEGTQMQMQKYKIKRSRINHIFISHLHGDHFFGLVGLLTSYGLMGRTADLYIYAPGPLQKIVEMQCTIGEVTLPYKLHFKALTTTEVILQNNKLKVTSFPTTHRIPCFGFLFEEIKNPRKIDLDKCKEYEIPAAYYRSLQLGMDYERKNGSLVKNNAVTIANDIAKKYAFCADTSYDESFLPLIMNIDLLYHETTYLKDLEERAVTRGHSTTIQAATLAVKANVKSLLVGHFSSKYVTIDVFQEECITVFPNTSLAIEGASILF